VRQVFYRLVGAHDYPKTESDYKKLCHHLANARRGRLIPFEAIRDDGVTSYAVGHFDDEDHFHRYVRKMAEGYTRNKLASQPRHIEVWCEAAGMLPQLANAAEPYSVKVYSSSGFDSLTAKKTLANRICRVGKMTTILHLGDYDPSGESIFTSFAEDVTAFVEADRPWFTVGLKFKRIALTARQVEEFELPTAPAKESDSRSAAWDGETCQLEAMPPDQISELLVEAITRWFDLDLLDEDEKQEEIDRRNIARALPAPEGSR
jgi:hypothetical protein